MYFDELLFNIACAHSVCPYEWWPGWRAVFFFSQISLYSLNKSAQDCLFLEYRSIVDIEIKRRCNDASLKRLNQTVCLYTFVLCAQCMRSMTIGKSITFCIHIISPKMNNTWCFYAANASISLNCLYILFRLYCIRNKFVHIFAFIRERTILPIIERKYITWQCDKRIKWPGIQHKITNFRCFLFLSLSLTHFLRLFWFSAIHTTQNYSRIIEWHKREHFSIDNKRFKHN